MAGRIGQLELQQVLVRGPVLVLVLVLHKPRPMMIRGAKCS